MDDKNRILFNQIYQTEILPIFRNYEVYRKRTLTGIIIQMILFVLLSFICLFSPFLLFYLPDNYPQIFKILVGVECTSPILPMVMFATTTLPIAIIVINILIYKNCSKKINDFASTLKKDCLQRFMKAFDSIKWDNNKNIIDDNELSESALFPDFEKRKTDDEFKGIYKDITFRISEFSLLMRIKTSRSEAYTSVFKGVAIVFKYNKNIKNHTIVATKRDFTKKNQYLLIYFLGLLSVITGWREVSWRDILVLILVSLPILLIMKLRADKQFKLEKVTLEDPKFNKRFNVYSADQVEARYHLTTGFMERFQNLNTAFGSNKAKCAFYNKDKIMIAISTKKNLFEIGSMFKSLENPEAVQCFYNELSSIIDMIDYFKLNEHTGL